MTKPQIRRKNGKIEAFDTLAITRGIAYAMLEVLNRTTSPPIPRDYSKLPENLILNAKAKTESVKKELEGMEEIEASRLHVIVESVLLREDEATGVAYGNYRRDRQEARDVLAKMSPQTVTRSNGKVEPFNPKMIETVLSNAMGGLRDVDTNEIFAHATRHMMDGMKTVDITKQLAKSTSMLISEGNDYDYLAARLFLDAYTHEAVLSLQNSGQISSLIASSALKKGGYPPPYQGYGLLAATLKKGMEDKNVSPILLDGRFDLEALEAALKPEGDSLHTYQGIVTIYQRYVLKNRMKERYELPQVFLMRVAMGLSIYEKNPTERAIEFYEGYAYQYNLSSTPTLFNSGLVHSQLASCYLQTVGDDLRQIYGSYRDHALMSKFAGGIGTDWTQVRATGSHIGGTNGESKGLVPWLKQAEQTTNAVNQGGKRKGACAAYLQSWHFDFTDFMQMRYTQGADSIRIEQMNTVAFMSDLQMKRSQEKKPWTMFSPDQTPDLVDLYGKAFEQRYEEYERIANESDQWVDTTISFNNNRSIKARVSTMGHPLHPCKQIFDADELYTTHIAYLLSSGHPWITFKDPANICSPQDHVGVVHNSNLCTEITLNTKATTYVDKNRDEVKDRGEVAVCNLGSVNLVNMLTRDPLTGKAESINLPLLYKTVKRVHRGLDNVIDINFYPIEETKASNMKHRPIGLGLMGWHHMLQELDIPYDSNEAVELADHISEHILFATLAASCDLAEEKGAYESFEGSKWSRGILPQDTRRLLAQERGPKYCRFHIGGVIPEEKWEEMRQRIQKVGVRNSNHIAIAPTATIGKLAGGASQGVDPTRGNLYAEDDMSGSFTRCNPVLVARLKREGIWTKKTAPHIRAEIIARQGSVQGIDMIPEHIQKVFKHAMEIHPAWTVRQASRRQKWIDQTMSLNIYLDPYNPVCHYDIQTGEPIKPGRLLKMLYMAAWEEGLKTTYYLKTPSATEREKTTVKVGPDQKKESQPQNPTATLQQEPAKPFMPVGTMEKVPAFCSIDDPGCEACQ